MVCLNPPYQMAALPRGYWWEVRFLPKHNAVHLDLKKPWSLTHLSYKDMDCCTTFMDSLNPEEIALKIVQCSEKLARRNFGTRTERANGDNAEFVNKAGAAMDLISSPVKVKVRYEYD